LNIEQSKSKPIYVNWDKKTVCFIRKGTSIFSAKPNEIKQMYENRSQKTKSNETRINQKAKGKDILQVGVNSGTIIKTNKVTRKNEIKPNPDIHISEQQAKQIKEKIDEIVLLNEDARKIKNQNDKKRFYKQTWNSFYQRFNLTSYKMLARDEFEEAIKWLQKQIAFEHRPKLRKRNNEKWKNSLYSAIYAKSKNNLGMDKEDLMNYAFEKLELKKPISSLKELSDTRLNKLYRYIFSEKN